MKASRSNDSGRRKRQAAPEPAPCSWPAGEKDEPASLDYSKSVEPFPVEIW